MVGTYLPVALVALAFVMIIGSLSSTADSDLAALSSIVMTDVYGQSVGRKNVDPKLMLLLELLYRSLRQPAKITVVGNIEAPAFQCLLQALNGIAFVSPL